MISKAWGASPDDVWAIVDSRIHHFDGAGWSDTGVSRVGDIDGAARDDVWAVGDRVWHFDGEGWESRGALVSPSPYYLRRAVAAIGEGQAIVGIDSHLYRYTPGGRVDESTIRPGGGYGAIWGAAADDLWLGGIEGLSRWNGSRWTRGRAAVLSNVRSLSGLAADDVWAAGSDRDGDSWLGHFDGAAWTSTRAIDLDLGNAPDDRWLRLVFGSASGEVWIAGIESAPERPFIARRQGAAWIRTATPYEVWALWAGDGAVWIVPTSGDQVARRSTGGWTAFEPPPGRWIGDVFGFASNDVWVVGSGGYIGHFDGAAWSQVASGTDTDLRKIWGRASDDLWVTGTDEVLHWDGAAWSRQAVPAGVSLSAVFEVEGEVWASGNHLLRRQ